MRSTEPSRTEHEKSFMNENNLPNVRFHLGFISNNDVINYYCRSFCGPRFTPGGWVGNTADTKSSVCEAFKAPAYNLIRINFTATFAGFMPCVSSPIIRLWITTAIKFIKLRYCN